MERSLLEVVQITVGTGSFLFHCVSVRAGSGRCEQPWFITSPPAR